MKYKIKYEYQTGSSFGYEDTDGILELGWNDLTVAKANLKRIAAHTKMVKELDQKKWEVRLGKKDAKVDVFEPYKKEDWFVNDKSYGISENCIILYTDEGKPWQFWCPWCGYFETLYSAKIIVDVPEENDMEFYA